MTVTAAVLWLVMPLTDGPTRSRPLGLNKAVRPHVSPLLFDILKAIRAGVRVMRRNPAVRDGDVSRPQTVLPFVIHKD
jgi:hypothetical protein